MSLASGSFWPQRPPLVQTCRFPPGFFAWGGCFVPIGSLFTENWSPPGTFVRYHPRVRPSYKMQVAAKRTAEREAKPASTDTTPSAQPTEAAADVEGVSTEPDDHLLRIGSDFAMAFVYSGTGKATRRVAWLGRVEKLRHNVVYPVDVSLVPYVYA